MADVFLNVILPTFLVAGIAAALQRWKKISVMALSQTTLYLLTPALLFTSILGQRLPAETSVRLAVATVAVTLLVLALARFLSRLLRHDRPMQSAFQLATAFPNSGNMGLPVLLLGFGQKGLDMGIIVFLTQSLLGQSLGIFVAARGGMVSRAAFGQVFRIPSLYAVAAAVAIRLADITLPALIAKPIAMLSQAAIPVMLVVLGFQMGAEIQVERPGSLFTAVSVRLLASGGIAYGVGALMGLHGLPLAVLVVIYSMPAMVYSIVLATEFGVDPRFVANAVIASTVCSMLTLTGLIAYLKRYVVGG